MDFTKVCWYCHMVTMVAKGSFYECAECGATWNPVPELYSLGLVTERNVESGRMEYSPRKMRRLIGVGKKGR